MRPAPRPQSLATRVRLILVVAIGGLVLGYTGLATAAWFYLRNDGLHVVRWADVAGLRWRTIVHARGEQHIALAHSYAKQDRATEALAFARSGLAKCPTNRLARLLVARLTAAHDPAAAQRTLLAGLPEHRRDPKYVAMVLQWLFARQEDDLLASLAEELGDDDTLPEEVRRIAAHAGATVCHARGDYDRAETLLRSVPGLPESREGQLLLTRIDWDRGFRALAFENLSTLALRFPDDATVRHERLRRLREFGRFDAARREALAFQIAQPDSWPARLELLRAYHDGGDSAAVAREIDYLLQARPDPAALLAVGAFAAATGSVDLARRLTLAARVSGLPVEPHLFLEIEASLAARDFTTAIHLLDGVATDRADWSPQSQMLANSLRAVALWGAGEAATARLFLTRFLQEPRLRAENLLAVADHFSSLDAQEQARQVLARAVSADPMNQAALRRLIEVDLNANRVDELPANLERLLTMRRPSADLLRVAQHKLGSDHFLFFRERARVLERVTSALDRQTTRNGGFTALPPPTR